MTRWGIVALLSLGACQGSVDNPPPGTSPDGNVPPSGDGPGSQMGMPDAAGGVGEPAELQGITLYHNQVRAMVDTATPLPALQWDPQLADYAKQYLAQCKDTEAPTGLVDHNPDRFGVAGYQYIGENIFASGGTATAQQAVQVWAGEKANYNYDTNGCNGVCGHYTQVVWRETTHLGCALYTCNGLTYPSTIICDYGPGGNNGSKPY